jgi:CTP synthase
VLPHEITLQLVEHPLVSPLYGDAKRITETTDLAYGLNPDYAAALAGVGLRTAATDPNGGRPYLHVLDGHRFHVTAAYLPQLKSRRGTPHPLFKGLLDAALES